MINTGLSKKTASLNCSQLHKQFSRSLIFLPAYLLDVCVFLRLINYK